MNRGMQLLRERFGRDSVMALATMENGAPSVRNVNAYYENGAFYVITEKLRAAFAAWIDNGHNDLSDPNCVILRIRLTDALLFANGTRYELDFAKEGRE